MPDDKPWPYILVNTKQIELPANTPVVTLLGLRENDELFLVGGRGDFVALLLPLSFWRMHVEERAW